MDDLVARLRAAGCVFADDEAELLREAADGPELEALVARRTAGEPLEHLLGWTAFAGRHWAVGPGCFVPRRRTELLLTVAGRGLPPGAVAVELCAGASVVAASLVTDRPDLEVHAVEIDPDAAVWGRRNLGAAGTVHVGDLYAALPDRLRGRVNLVVANAPYVPSGRLGQLPPEARLHEPRIALDGGIDGVAVHRRIASGAAEWLADGGRVAVETSQDLAAATAAAFVGAGFSTRTVEDSELGGVVVVACGDSSSPI